MLSAKKIDEIILVAIKQILAEITRTEKYIAFLTKLKEEILKRKLEIKKRIEEELKKGKTLYRATKITLENFIDNFARGEDLKDIRFEIEDLKYKIKVRLSAVTI